MERVQALIDKLVRQRQQNGSIDDMLVTVQMLQNELLVLKRKGETSGSSKIAVILPSRAAQVTERKAVPEKKAEAPKVWEQPAAIPPVAEPLPQVEKLPLRETFSPPPPEPVLPQPKPEPYVLQKPTITEVQPEVKPESVPEPQPETAAGIQHELFQPHFDALSEAPTLIHQEPQKEVYHLISEPQESLNDKLKQETPELAHKLKDVPIKDLRKAIGVNDKYVFVNELFRGDEAMYERSIKTINSFHILPEAEYWINRELKFKLGWSDQKETVQHFYHLVRRRFS